MTQLIISLKRVLTLILKLQDLFGIIYGIVIQSDVVDS